MSCRASGICLLYTCTCSELDDTALTTTKSQMWHLLLWSVLTYKPAMTHFFVMHTAAPLGKPLPILVYFRAKLERGQTVVFGIFL